MKGNLDSYREKHEEFKRLLEEGKSLSQISKELGIPKSTLSYWKSKGRKKTSLEEMEAWLEKNGPSPSYIVSMEFPKHSEIYNRSAARGGKIRKFHSSLKGKLRDWYYLEGQEKELRERIASAMKKISMAKSIIRKRLSEE